VAVVVEPRRRPPPDAEQSMDGRRLRAREPLRERRLQVLRGVAEGNPQSRGGLPRGCRQRDLNIGICRHQRREERGHRGGLAGPRSTDEHRERVAARAVDRSALLGRAITEQRVDDGSNGPHRWQVDGGTAEQILGDSSLVDVVALGIQPRAVEHERRSEPRDEIARRNRCRPAVGRRPWERRDIDVVAGEIGDDRAGDGAQVDAHVPDAGCSSGKRRRQHDGRIVLTGEPGERGRDVRIGVRQHAGLAEGSQDRRSHAAAPCVRR